MQTTDVTPDKEDATAIEDGPFKGYVRILESTDEGWLQNVGSGTLSIVIGDPAAANAARHMVGTGEGLDTSMFKSDIYAKPYGNASVSFTEYAPA